MKFLGVFLALLAFANAANFYKYGSNSGDYSTTDSNYAFSINFQGTNFSYADKNHPSVTISTNGLLIFGDAEGFNAKLPAGGSYSWPADAPTSPAIAVLYTGLKSEGENSAVYYRSVDCTNNYEIACWNATEAVHTAYSCSQADFNATSVTVITYANQKINPEDPVNSATVSAQAVLISGLYGDNKTIRSFVHLVYALDADKQPYGGVISFTTSNTTESFSRCIVLADAASESCTVSDEDSFSSLHSYSQNRIAEGTFFLQTGGFYDPVALYPIDFQGLSYVASGKTTYGGQLDVPLEGRYRFTSSVGSYSNLRVFGDGGVAFITGPEDTTSLSWSAAAPFPYFPPNYDDTYNGVFIAPFVNSINIFSNKAKPFGLDPNSQDLYISEYGCDLTNLQDCDALSVEILTRAQADIRKDFRSGLGDFVPASAVVVSWYKNSPYYATRSEFQSFVMQVIVVADSGMRTVTYLVYGTGFSTGTYCALNEGGSLNYEIMAGLSDKYTPPAVEGQPPMPPNFYMLAYHKRGDESNVNPYDGMTYPTFVEQLGTSTNVGRKGVFAFRIDSFVSGIEPAGPVTGVVPLGASSSSSSSAASMESSSSASTSHSSSSGAEAASSSASTTTSSSTAEAASSSTVAPASSSATTTTSSSSASTTTSSTVAPASSSSATTTTSSTVAPASSSSASTTTSSSTGAATSSSSSSSSASPTTYTSVLYFSASANETEAANVSFGETLYHTIVSAGATPNVEYDILRYVVNGKQIYPQAQVTGRSQVKAEARFVSQAIVPIRMDISATSQSSTAAKNAVASLITQLSNSNSSVVASLSSKGLSNVAASDSSSSDVSGSSMLSVNSLMLFIGTLFASLMM